MPCSSPRSSGWRATDWIIEPKMLPMPTPAPSDPSPMPSASAIALPAFVTSPDVAARRVLMFLLFLVLQLDRLEHEHQPEEGQDQHVAGEHVRVEPDAERDQPHELAEHLERDDQRQHHLRHLGDRKST